MLLGDSVCIRETPGGVGIVVPWVLPEGLLARFPVSVMPSCRWRSAVEAKRSISIPSAVRETKPLVPMVA